MAGVPPCSRSPCTNGEAGGSRLERQRHVASVMAACTCAANIRGAADVIGRARSSGNNVPVLRRGVRGWRRHTVHRRGLFAQARSRRVSERVAGQSRPINAHNPIPAEATPPMAIALSPRHLPAGRDFRDGRDSVIFPTSAGVSADSCAGARAFPSAASTDPPDSGDPRPRRARRRCRRFWRRAGVRRKRAIRGVRRRARAHLRRDLRAAFALEAR